MASLMPTGRQQFLTSAGIPLLGGKVFTYAAGTVTPKTTWSDQAGTVANTNPIILDTRGEALIFWAGSYKVVVQDILGNVIYTTDNYVTDAVGTLAASTGAGLIGGIQLGTGAVLRTVQDKLRESVSILDFGATTSDVTGITNLSAINAALLASDTVLIPAGTFVISGAIYLGGTTDAGLASILKRGKKLIGMGSFASKLVAASGFSSNYMVFVGNTNYLVDGKFIVNNEVSGLLLDNTNMANTTSTYGLYTLGTYNNYFRDLQLSYAQNPAQRWDFSCANGTYTSTFIDCNFSQGQISSSTQGDVTSLNFISCSGAFLNIVNGVAINFDHYVSQGSPTVGYATNRVQIATSANVSFMNGDVEGSGVMFNIFNSIGIKVEGNNVAAQGSYTSLSSVAIAGIAGQFSCAAVTGGLIVGQPIIITGTFGGTGSIAGYTNPTTYYVIATNGTTTFTLSSSAGGAAITTTAGTPTGLIYSVGNIMYALNGAQQVRSRDNVFMNWLTGPAATQGVYATYAGTNRKLSLNDFSGDSYTGASYATTATQTLTNNTNVVLNYETVKFDSGVTTVNGFPTVSTINNLVTTGAAWKFTCPVYGVYHVEAALMIAAFVQTTDYAYIIIAVNGVEQYRNWNSSPVFSGNLQLAISGDVRCSPGDYIQIIVLCNAVATRSVNAASTANYVAINFTGNF